MSSGSSIPTKPRRVLTLLVGRDDGVVISHFGVEHDGKLWLVTAWLIDRATGNAVPERMIRVDNLSPRPTKGDAGDKFDYMNILLPRAVIEGVTEAAAGFEVRSLPSSPIVHRSELFELPSVLRCPDERFNSPSEA